MSLWLCLTKRVPTEIYERNITHNLAAMAKAAGIYGVMWRPEENGIKTAGKAIEPLKAGIALMKADPDRFRQFNPPNGWGSYEGLIEAAEEFLCACEKDPDAQVRASR